MLAHSESFDAIGTHWQIDTIAQLPATTLAQIHTCVEAFDVTYSRFRPDSLVTRMTKQAGEYLFPADVIPLITLYRQLYEMTEGRMTPLIGSMLEKAGYDANYSFQAHQQSELPEWDTAMTWQGRQLTTTQPITLDIGAAGKGYLIDKIASLLADNHIEAYAIDGSGDISHKGASPYVIGLEHPTDPRKVIGTVILQNQSICASAINRRKWGNDMHHIFDPTTKAPTRDIVASWVIANDAMTADGLATALFFADPAALAKQFDFQFVRMHSNGGVEYSTEFNGELFI